MPCLKNLCRYTGIIDRVYSEQLLSEKPFMDIAANFAHRQGTVVLMSGGDSDCARYNILAVNPYLSLRSYVAGNIIGFEDQSILVESDPLLLLKDIAGHYRLLGPEFPQPVAAGLFGYLAYDLKDFIENLPKTTVDDLGLPYVCMYAPSAILVEDRQTGERRLHIPVRKKGETDTCDNDRKMFFGLFDNPASTHERFSSDKYAFESAFSQKTYMAAVEKIKDYIVSGHIYQANLSQRFETTFYGSAFTMFKTLFETAPAPFYAYVNAGDHEIVSTSPERFLKRSGSRVETRPIKGTRPRGKTKEEDRANARALVKSKKDDAELSMIVDLMRNDLGRVCRGGSVRVADHRRLESYRNVFHLVSVVQGELMDEKDSVDLLYAAFPGGSVTGCPKIRAMEIIDELEPCRRHVYTGSIGYIGFHDTMDLSIAIRTATVVRDCIVFSVGGGVVFDSEPADEYEETLHKGRSIMGLFEKGAGGAGKAKCMAWHNGTMIPESDVCFSVADKGVSYGYGFFETIRVDKSRPAYLADHIKRFDKTWLALFGKTPPDLTWEDIVGQVISENRLEDTTAAVKILAACRDDEKEQFFANLVVTAAPYRHRLDLLQKPGLDVAVYPHPRLTFLADHKTLNYLYYYLAGKWAKNRKADEAVVLNSDGTVSETNTANILCVYGKEVVMPVSGHVLPGIMEKHVIKFLEKSGYRIVKQKIPAEHLAGFDAVILTNSLMGAVPVTGINGRPVSFDTGLCDRINSAVL